MNKRGALVAIGLCYAAPANAQDADDVARLTRLVEAQQAQIEKLESRIAAIEGPAPSTTPTAVPPVAVAQASAQNGRRDPAPMGRPLPSEAHPPRIVQRVAELEAAQSKAGHVDWSKGTPEFSNADGSITFRPRGRMLIDFGTTTGSEVANRNITATQVRSVRLGMEGSVGNHLSYVVEGDFADNEVAMKSVYLAWTTPFLGQQAEFALGNRLNDRSLDGSSGTISVPFLERNVVAQGIIPVRGFFGLGAAARIYGKRWHLGVQVSGDDINSPGTASDGRTIAARAHWNPIKNEDWLVHLGIWGFHEDLAADVTRPTRAIAVGGFYNDNLRIAPGTFPNADHGAGWGLEGGLFHKSLWTYAEYGARHLASQTGRATDQSAWAIASGWFVTGETAPYLARGGVWSRPRVLHPFINGGSGAIELAARYEALDYSDNPTAGRGTALTLGVNWYLNAFIRLQLNGIDWSVSNPGPTGRVDDHGQSLMARAQIAF